MNQTSFQLVGSLTSPYTRMIRVLCAELQIPLELVRTEPFGRNSKEQLALIKAHNPLVKVPTLIMPEGELFESRVIANYLLRAHASRARSDFSANSPFSIATENFCSTVYGCVDAGAQRFMLTKSDATLDTTRGYFPRFQEIISSGMQWVDDALAQGQLEGNFSFAHIALLSGVEWFDKRKVYDSSHLSHIRELHKNFASRPSLVSTRIPENI